MDINNLQKIVQDNDFRIDKIDYEYNTKLNKSTMTDQYIVEHTEKEMKIEITRIYTFDILFVCALDISGFRIH